MAKKTKGKLDDRGLASESKHSPVGHLVFSVRFAGVTTAQAGVPVLPRRYVHILIEPRFPLSTIMKAIKGVTSRNANKLLNRTGKVFWQDESFDHWTRDEPEENNIRRYIENNPVRAHLVANPEDWPWSRAKR
jgi:hypothetical protein